MARVYDCRFRDKAVQKEISEKIAIYTKRVARSKQAYENSKEEIRNNKNTSYLEKNRLSKKRKVTSEIYQSDSYILGLLQKAKIARFLGYETRYLRLKSLDSVAKCEGNNDDVEPKDSYYHWNGEDYSHCFK